MELPAGDHALLLRCSSVGEPAACAGSRDIAGALSDGPAFAGQAHGFGPGLCRGLACDPAEPGPGDWPKRLHGQGLVLSVLSGRAQSAGVVASLRPGQAWACRVRLPAPGGKALPLLANFTVPQPGRGCLTLSLDKDFHGERRGQGPWIHAQDRLGAAGRWPPAAGA